MPALDFPASPTLNQVYTANGKSWIWNGNSWNPYNTNAAITEDANTIIGLSVFL